MANAPEQKNQIIDTENAEITLLKRKKELAKKIKNNVLANEYGEKIITLQKKQEALENSYTRKLFRSFSTTATAGNLLGTAGFVSSIITRTLEVAIQAANQAAKIVSAFRFFIEAVATPLALVSIALANLLELNHLYQNEDIQQRKTRYGTGLFSLAGLGVAMAFVFGAFVAPHFTLPCIFVGMLAAGIYKDAYFISQAKKNINDMEEELKDLRSLGGNSGDEEKQLKILDLEYQIQSQKLAMSHAKTRILINGIMALGAGCLISSGFAALLIPHLGAALAIVGALLIMGCVIASTIVHYQQQFETKKLEETLIKEQNEKLKAIENTLKTKAPSRDTAVAQQLTEDKASTPSKDKVLNKIAINSSAIQKKIGNTWFDSLTQSPTTPSSPRSTSAETDPLLLATEAPLGTSFSDQQPSSSSGSLQRPDISSLLAEEEPPNPAASHTL